MANTLRLIVFSYGIIAPILLYLCQMRIPRRARSTIEAYLLNSRAWESENCKHIRPTRGQALYVTSTILLNAALCASKLYSVVVYDGDWDAPGATFSVSLSNRLGALSTANISLVILYSARNNFLLDTTGMARQSICCHG